jgi:hypothetical protein
MKRLMSLLILVVLLSVMLSACVVPVDQNEASKLCKQADDFGLTHGKCVSYFTSASGIADYCRDNWDHRVWYLGVRVGPFENQGACVSYINSLDRSLLPPH